MQLGIIDYLVFQFPPGVIVMGYALLQNSVDCTVIFSIWYQETIYLDC